MSERPVDACPLCGSAAVKITVGPIEVYGCRVCCPKEGDYLFVKNAEWEWTWGGDYKIPVIGR